jgi:23S rRNA (cytidine1920-2'-O)/16S rRNA (cytidine1409-2'-O)-methyltransferase
VGGAPAAKAASQVAVDDMIALAPAPSRWVSRGGYKLEAAVDAFALAVDGRVCLDAGASTGGFTDVLLAHGAARVVAVDVGYGQLDWRLRNDERVVVLERTNVRHLVAADLPSPPPELVVADLSFISLTLVLPALVRVAAPAADLVPLVKPQFEVGRDAVGRGGVVRDPAAWRSALRRVVAAAVDQGLGLVGACASPLPGPAGNVEFFLHLRRDGSADNDRVVAAALAQAQAREAPRSG